jgi:hypothetical protein
VAQHLPGFTFLILRVCINNMSEGRKRKVLTLETKIAILDAVEKGEKKGDIAVRFKMPPSSLSTILKQAASL